MLVFVLLHLQECNTLEMSCLVGLDCFNCSHGLSYYMFLYLVITLHLKEFM